MNDFIKIENILRNVKSKIETHNEFKKEYNKQLAFDFSLFNFFNVGENKVSQILAYFLDEKQNHGQGNVFLNEFVELFFNQKIDTTNSLNICEKVITENRRIDIYIKLPNKTIAIENKIWADDQKNQLKDYATYLEKESKGNYRLFYLTPYGAEPTEKSIDAISKQKLTDDEKLKVISYQHDIINLINKWLIICEADNVTHFIKEFKKYLEIKFLGNNTLNMSKSLGEIIYKNQTEIQSLVNEYKSIENEVTQKLNTVGKLLDNEFPKVNSGIEISKSGLFNWYGSRVYKYSVSKGGNKIWIQFVKEEINLFSNYYLEKGTDDNFKELIESSNINKSAKIDHKQDKFDLISLFLKQIEIANDTFGKYEKLINENKQSVANN